MNITTPPQTFPNSLSLVCDLLAKHLILMNQVVKSALQVLNSLILVNNSLGYVGSVHTLSNQQSLLLIRILKSLRQFLVLRLEPDVFLLFSEGEVLSHSNKLSLQLLKPASLLFILAA